MERSEPIMDTDMDVGPTTMTSDTFMALTFDLDGERFAISVKNVQEVIDPLEMTQVPNADPFAPGLINVRGAVVPVLNLQHRLGIRSTETTTDTRFVVIEAIIDEDRTNFAIIADSVHEVFEVEESNFHLILYRRKEICVLSLV